MQSSLSAATKGPEVYELLAKDPLLYNLELYGEFRRKCSLNLRRLFTETLTEAAILEPSVTPFCQYLSQLLVELESASEKKDSIDPYFSTIFRVWLDGLARGVDWVRNGAAAMCLTHFADLPAFKKDLAVEYPHLVANGGKRLTRVIDESIRLIPVNEIAASPRLSARVQQCLPAFPDTNLYQAVDEAVMDALQEHFTVSLNFIKTLDRVAYLGLKRNIHTIYVTVIKTKKKSFGSRNDCPGSLIVGLPKHRLRQQDTGAMASQFYHEHCHNKLSLYCQVTEFSFPPDDVYISSFKNENRNIEAILHTIYPFAIECIIRLASLSSYEEKRRHRSVAYLASVGSRLRLMTDIFRLDSISTSSREFERILELSEVVLELIEQEIQKCPPHIRRVHREEGRRVLKRYIWDIGQLLCRGVSVKDPHLRDVEYSEGRAKFNFRGKRYTASLRPARNTPGNYGSYVEALL